MRRASATPARGCSPRAATGSRWAISTRPASTALAAELGASPFHVDAMDTAALQGFVDAAARGARRSRLRLVERRRADRRLGRAGQRRGFRPLVRDQRARACRRVRRGGAAPARRGRRRDLHHRIQLRAALGAEARARTRSPRPRRSPSPARSRATTAPRASASTRSARAGSTRPSTRPRGRTSAGASASSKRCRGSCRSGASARPRRRASWPASCSRTTPAYMTGHALVADGGESPAGLSADPALRCYAHDGFAYPLPEGHRFPLGKYALLRARVAADPRFEVHDARAATREELLLRAHAPTGSGASSAASSTRDELRALGLPWSPALVERARRSVGATLEAADAALADGRRRQPRRRHAPRVSRTSAAASASSTTSWRRPARCATAGGCAACSWSTSTCTRATARTPRWPATTRRSRSRSTASATTRSAACRAISSATSRRGTGDDAYLDALAALLPRGDRARARRALLLPRGSRPVRGRPPRTAGADARRPRGRATGSCARSCCAPGIPVCVTLAGGYAERIEDTVAINLATLRAFA